jgi:hypothetical protein
MRSAKPPVTPERRLEKVLGISRANAIGVLACSGSSLLLNLLVQDWVFSGFAALAVVAGIMELTGQTRLRAGDFGGLHWLLGAQGCLYTVVAGYVMWRMRYFDPAALWAQLPEENRTQFLEQMQKAGAPESDRDLFLRAFNFLLCTTLIVVSTLYQGGLAWWYRRQRFAIAEALHRE